jgi:putative FmdB family regulatory protein
MPTYNYKCKVCGVEFEKFVPFSKNPEDVICPNGHKDIRRLFSPPVIVFKGKGFYITDNRPSSK